MDEYKNLVYLRITDNCNFECRHCCYKCSPGKDTMSFENIKNVLSNMPKNAFLQISGGEIFTVKNLLYKTLEYIKDTEICKNYGVQTNGFWIKDKECFEKTLNELIGLGITAFDWAGLDRFHEEQGLNIDDISSILKDYRNKNIKFHSTEPRKNSYSYVRARPFGRAKEALDESELCKEECDCSINYYWIKNKGITLTINPNGNANLCCFNIDGLNLGSAIENPIGKLVENAVSDKFIEQFITRGAYAIAAEKFGDEKLDELLSRNCICAICESMFKNYKISKK